MKHIFLLYTPIGYIKTLRRKNVKETISNFSKNKNPNLETGIFINNELFRNWVN